VDHDIGLLLAEVTLVSCMTEVNLDFLCSALVSQVALPRKVAAFPCHAYGAWMTGTSADDSRIASAQVLDAVCDRRTLFIPILLDDKTRYLAAVVHPQETRIGIFDPRHDSTVIEYHGRVSRIILLHTNGIANRRSLLSR
jgi:hypothetical protein